MNENSTETIQNERNYSCRILRYSPNLVRDEWVNIGVLLFDPLSGERRLRFIEEQEEYTRVRRLHRDMDEELLRRLRDGLEEQFASAANGSSSKSPASIGASFEELLRKLDERLSNALQLAPPKVVTATDLDIELDRLYADQVAVPRAPARAGTAGSRGQMRSYCSQVLKQARLWERIDKLVPVSEFTFPGDPMRIDYSYRRNGTRGFAQTLAVSRAPGTAKELAYTAERIAAKTSLKTEFTAITDIDLAEASERNAFVRSTLRDAGVEPVALGHFPVWVAKLKATMQ